VSPWRRIRQGHGGQRLERRTLDSLPHNGAVVRLLAVCGMTHRESYRDIVMVAIVSALLALAAVIVLGSIFGSF
jgi:H+/gluconate symporter-like permease